MKISNFKSHTKENIDIIENGSISDVIVLAKTHYNLFVPNSGKLYTMMCNKIKERLDKEGLPYDICRPE